MVSPLLLLLIRDRVEGRLVVVDGIWRPIGQWEELDDTPLELEEIERECAGRKGRFIAYQNADWT